MDHLDSLSVKDFPSDSVLSLMIGERRDPDSQEVHTEIELVINRSSDLRPDSWYMVQIEVERQNPHTVLTVQGFVKIVSVEQTGPASWCLSMETTVPIDVRMPASQDTRQEQHSPTSQPRSLQLPELLRRLWTRVRG